MSEWRKYTLEELADDITVGFVGSMASEYIEGGIPFLRSLNVEPLRINQNDLKYISPEFHRRIKKSRLTPGDVVIVRTGKPGACAVVPAWLSDANCSDLVIVRCGSKINNQFLAYYINTVSSGHVASHMVGAVQQHFNVSAARTLPVYLPPLDEQKAIVAILAAFDDKIELNRQMNETLEATARAIFKDWFVDFGPSCAKIARTQPYLASKIWDLFPERLGEDGKPEGWDLLRLDQIANQSKGLVTPTNNPDELFEHYSLPAFDNGQNPAADFGETIMSNKTPVPEGAVLLSKLNPETSRVWIPNGFNGTQQVSSTEFLVFQPIPPAGRGLLYCLFSNVQFKQMLEGMVTGTSKSHQRISPPALLNSTVLIGTRRLFAAFEETVAPILLKLLANRENSKTLASTRDLLLPKLMSGGVRVSDAELTTKAALARAI